MGHAPGSHLRNRQSAQPRRSHTLLRDVPSPARRPRVRWRRCWVVDYALTRRRKKRKKVIPVLLEILRDRGGEVRESAAEALGMLPSLDREATRALRAVASDPSDPVREMAEKVLSRQKKPFWRLKFS